MQGFPCQRSDDNEPLAVPRADLKADGEALRPKVGGCRQKAVGPAKRHGQWLSLGTMEGHVPLESERQRWMRGQKRNTLVEEGANGERKEMGEAGRERGKEEIKGCKCLSRQAFCDERHPEVLLSPLSPLMKNSAFHLALHLTDTWSFLSFTVLSHLAILGHSSPNHYILKSPA